MYILLFLSFMLVIFFQQSSTQDDNIENQRIRVEKNLAVNFEQYSYVTHSSTISLNSPSNQYYTYSQLQANAPSQDLVYSSYNNEYNPQNPLSATNPAPYEYFTYNRGSGTFLVLLFPFSNPNDWGYIDAKLYNWGNKNGIIAGGYSAQIQGVFSSVAPDNIDLNNSNIPYLALANSLTVAANQSSTGVSQTITIQDNEPIIIYSLSQGGQILP